MARAAWQCVMSRMGGMPPRSWVDAGISAAARASKGLRAPCPGPQVAWPPSARPMARRPPGRVGHHAVAVLRALSSSSRIKNMRSQAPLLHGRGRQTPPATARALFTLGSSAASKMIRLMRAQSHRRLPCNQCCRPICNTNRERERERERESERERERERDERSDLVRCQVSHLWARVLVGELRPLPLLTFSFRPYSTKRYGGKG